MISYRYRDKGTIIHKLNPFCKLAWIGSIIILALIFDNPLYLLLIFLSTPPVAAAAKVWREWSSFMKFTLYLCILVIFVNVLVNYNGSHILLEAPFRLPVLGTPRITLEAIFFGIGMSLRLLAMISAFALINFTLHPDDLMLAMVKIRLPYKSVLVTSLSTRFIPTLIDDVERISDVQRSRGLEFGKGNLKHKIKNRMSIIIPLLSNSLERTVQVAEAMESRAFGSGKGRTYYKEITMSRIDIVTLSASISAGLFGVFIRILGHGDYQYYPSFEQISLSSGDWSMLLILMLLLHMILLLALIRKKVNLD